MLVLLQTLLEQERTEGGPWWDVPSFLGRNTEGSLPSASTSGATSASDGRKTTVLVPTSDGNDSTDSCDDETDKELEDWLVSGLVDPPSDTAAGNHAIDEFKRKSREYFLKRLRARVFQDVSRDAAVPLPTDDVIALPGKADRRNPTDQADGLGRASVAQRELSHGKRPGESVARPARNQRTGLSDMAQRDPRMPIVVRII
jgi:hypothetical protein